jgi:hypothetical protein
MEISIKEITEKLVNGDITKDEADKILLDLFGVRVMLPNEDEICDELFEEINDFLLAHDEYPLPSGFRNKFGYLLAEKVINFFKQKIEIKFT